MRCALDTGQRPVTDSTTPTRGDGHRQQPSARVGRGLSRRAWMLAAAALGGAVMATVVTPSAHAQAAAGANDYPSRPIKFLVPFPPGSGTDSSARYFGKKITELTGQPVVIENRAGGNGFIAVQQVMGAPADGYTLFVGSNSTLSTNSALFKKLPYDPVGDFIPLTAFMKGPALMIVPPNSPYKTLPELIDAARKNPGKITYGSGSAGYQLMAELFSDQLKLQFLHVPYKGASDAVTAVAAGTVDFTIIDISAAAELARGGKVRPIALAADRRSPLLPDVPTTAQAGAPNFTAYTWVAAMAPINTPKPVVDKLVDLMSRIIAMQETKDFYASQGQEQAPAGPEFLRKFQLEEIDRWKRIAATAKVEQQ